jgi:hypothetical protein
MASCGWNWSSLKSHKPNRIANHRLNLLAQIGLKPKPELARLGAPEMWPHITGDERRKIAEVVISRQAFERPNFAAPGTAADRVGAARRIRGDVARPLFLADAGRIGMDVSPMPGEQLQEIVGKLYGTPKSILDGAKRSRI